MGEKLVEFLEGHRFFAHYIPIDLFDLSGGVFFAKNMPCKFHEMINGHNDSVELVTCLALSELQEGLLQIELIAPQVYEILNVINDPVHFRFIESISIFYVTLIDVILAPT